MRVTAKAARSLRRVGPESLRHFKRSFREALKLGHDYIGTEHILLGIVREGEGVAAQVLAALGAGEDQVREKVTEVLGRSAGDGVPDA